MRHVGEFELLTSPIRQSCLLLCATLSVAACLKAPTPPAPSQLTVAKPPVDVVQISSRELTAAGFEITTTDPANGIVVAKRLRTPTAHAGDVACKYQKGSIADKRAESTLIVTVNARSATGGSEVQISSTVQTDLSNMPPPFKAGVSDSDCASSGVVEKRIADALRA